MSDVERGGVTQRNTKMSQITTEASDHTTRSSNHPEINKPERQKCSIRPCAPCCVLMSSRGAVHGGEGGGARDDPVVV